MSASVGAGGRAGIGAGGAGVGAAPVVRVDFLGPAAAEMPAGLQVQAASLAQLAAAFAGNESAQKWLKISAVAINGQIAASLDAPLQDGDVVAILPPVCGG